MNTAAAGQPKDLDMVSFCQDIRNFASFYVVACGKKNASKGFDLYIYVL